MSVDPRQIAKMITEDPDEVNPLDNIEDKFTPQIDFNALFYEGGPSKTIDFEEIGLGGSYPPVPLPYKREPQDESNPLDNIKDEFAAGIDHLEYELDWTVEPGEPSTYEYPGSPDYNELTDWKVIAVNNESLYTKNGLPRDGKNRPVRDGTIPAGIAEKHSIFDSVVIDFDELTTVLDKYFEDHLDEEAQEYLNNW